MLTTMYRENPCRLLSRMTSATVIASRFVATLHSTSRHKLKSWNLHTTVHVFIFYKCFWIIQRITCLSMKRFVENLYSLGQYRLRLNVMFILCTCTSDFNVHVTCVWLVHAKSVAIRCITELTPLMNISVTFARLFQILLENYYYVTVRFLTLVKVAMQSEESTRRFVFKERLRELLVDSPDNIYQLLCELRHLMHLKDHRILATSLGHTTKMRCRIYGKYGRSAGNVWKTV